MRMKWLAACLVSAAVGALAGGLLMQRHARAEVEREVAEKLARVAARPSEGGEAPVLQQLLQRAAADRAELERLTRECAQASAAAAPKTDAAAPASLKVAFPTDLDPHFREKGLGEAFANALAATGVTGQVTTTDCSEFPCLVHGQVDALESMEQAQSDVKKLQESAASAYPGADFYLSTSEMKPDTDDGSGKILWTASFYPRDLPEDLKQQINRRVRDRKNEYFDAQQAQHRQ
jgi:hypothetical protein